MATACSELGLKDMVGSDKRSNVKAIMWKSGRNRKCFI